MQQEMTSTSSSVPATLGVAIDIVVGSACHRNYITLMLFTVSFALLVGIVTSSYDIPVRTAFRFLVKRIHQRDRVLSLLL